MLIKVEDAPLLPTTLNAIRDQLLRLLQQICYRVNRVPEHGTVLVDPGNIAGGASAEVEVSVAGLAVGDHVMAQCNDALETGLIPYAVRVKTTHKLCIHLRNVTAGAIDGASRTWSWLKLD